MHPEIAVHSRAINADEHAIGDTGPGRIFGPTVEAGLKGEIYLIKKFYPVSQCNHDSVQWVSLNISINTNLIRCLATQAMEQAVYLGFGRIVGCHNRVLKVLFAD